MAWSDALDPQSPAFGIAASANARVRVIAGPGTGKSFAMKRRVARLLEEGVEPASILAVTFTRVAAEDLHRELVGMGVPGCEALNGVTIHSLALRILMRNHVLGATGRIPRPLNDFELKPLEADLADAHGGVRELRKKIKAFEAAWARLQQDEPGYVQHPDDLAFERDLYGWLIFHRAMLIGEVIPQLYSYLHANPLAQERSEFRHILVDEFQDLNRAEQGVIALLSDAADVCIVGDDDQSIYSFKHAHPEGIRSWLATNAGADDLTLDDCRRCPTQVVAMANALIASNVNRPIPRALTPLAANGGGDVRILQYATLDDEVVGVTNLISGMVAGGIPPGDILVLAQRGVIGTPIYEALHARNIPVRSYYAEAELNAQNAQERFAYLKLLVDREDRVALRWLVGLNSANWRCRGYRRLRGYADGQAISPWQALCAIADGQAQVAHTGALVERFRVIRAELDRLGTLHADVGVLGVVDDLFPEGDDGVRDLRALSLSLLENDAGMMPEDFLTRLSDAITKPEIPSEIEDVRIMSLHKSKGLSAPVTIIAGCIEGLLPKQPRDGLSAAETLAEIEEQRRLFYVGISRVKSSPAAGKPGTLILTNSRMMPLATAMGAGIAPAQVNYGDAHMITSRFIREMGAAAPAPVPG
ncbi:ATP-dependent helicase [Sphingomonas sp. MG17]|uniref:DNA 3'-5' helicase n=1 Tax=Sphingomonas tagetis TaxID=2949092 RepID=A0A9X2HJC0_9SPHN|nr:ATP-dependent helicase [Sphingomonas tagetis]MCP3732286.1 ATP-dependent helicase [Sphingomonas tagetis]